MNDNTPPLPLPPPPSPHSRPPDINGFTYIRVGGSGGFRVVPRVPWNPSFMKVLIILYYDKLTRSVGPVDYIALMEPPTSRAAKVF